MVLTVLAHAQPTFPEAALREDLHHLRTTIIATHPAPFRYCSPQQFHAAFDSLDHTLVSPMTELQFLSHVASLYPLLGDGHTLFLPSISDQDRHKLFLPVVPWWDGERLWVKANGSAVPHIRPGDEIIAINGVAAADLMDTLLRRQVRDGHDLNYPTWILNSYFKEYHRFSFGEQKRFVLQLRTLDGPYEAVLDALPMDSIAAHLARRTPPVEPPRFGLRSVRPGLAVITIPSFERGDLDRSQVKHAFEQVRALNVRRLIIDLRGNQGGVTGPAKALLAHVLDTPFVLVRKGPAQGRRRPVRRPFTGQLAVLMDGGSFSATGMVLSCLERNRRAIFIGTRAGGDRIRLAGSPKRIRLPNTALQCFISTRLWHLSEQPDEGYGVEPTISVMTSIDDVLTGRDPVMEAALKTLD